jgi:hypothetical protein
MHAALSAFVAFALSLFGFHVGGTTWSQRITGDHGDALYSKAWAKDGRARFECVQSDTGRCWYTLFPADCKDEACTAKPLARFAVVRGDEREVSGVAEFRFCVSREPALPPVDCREPG